MKMTNIKTLWTFPEFKSEKLKEKRKNPSPTCVKTCNCGVLWGDNNLFCLQFD